MTTVLAIAVGGALGAVARYLGSGWIQGAAGEAFPWGTAGVNLIGSLALGFVLVWFQESVTSTEVRALTTVGFLGSFTTFSTFSLESLELVREGSWLRAGSYSLGSLLLGIAAVALGAFAAAAILRIAGRS